MKQLEPTALPDGDRHGHVVADAVRGDDQCIIERARFGKPKPHGTGGDAQSAGEGARRTALP